MSAVFETHYDDEPLYEGTHSGPDGSPYVLSYGANFQSCGVMVGLAAVRNPDTYLSTEDGDLITTEDGLYINLEGSEGLVTAVTEDTITISTVTYRRKGDRFAVYKTASRDSFISRIATDRLRGKKVSKPEKLNGYGWFYEDADLDRNENGNRMRRKNIPFGPGQPENARRRYR